MSNLLKRIMEEDIRYMFDFTVFNDGKQDHSVVRMSTSGSGGWIQGLTDEQKDILKERIQKALVEIGISTTQRTEP